MATVHRRTRRGRVTWRAVWREPCPNGKLRQRNKTFDKAADAKAYASKMQTEIERRGVGDPERHTAGRYLDRWLATLRDRGEHSVTTIEGYELCINIAKPWIGDIVLSKLTALDLDTAYAKLLKQGGRRGKSPRPLSPGTVINVHRCLHAALDQARKWRLIPENPAQDATPPSAPSSQPRAFTTDKVRLLLDAAAGHGAMTHAIVSTLLVCGLRRSELLGLAFDALDLEAGTLEVRRTVVAVKNQPVVREKTKTQASRRTMRIPPELVTLLRAQRTRIQEQVLKWGQEYRREPLFVFPGLAGAPMTPQLLTHCLRRLMRRVGISGQPCHGWRHTAATQLLHSGTNIKTVQARLGHTTPAITMALYVDPDEEKDAGAAEHLGGMIERK